MNVIEVEGLTKLYKPSPLSKEPTVVALKDVSFQVEKETVYTVLGPNGAGKTTLIQVLAGLITSTEGRVRIAGIPIEDKKAVSKMIGFFSSTGKGFWKFLTGWQNLEYFASLFNLVGPSAKKKIAEMVELFGMGSYIHREMQGYSNGMKQRLLLARCLLHDPQILLFDEPIAYLDPIAVRDFHFLIRNQLINVMKKTVVLSTHQLEEAQEMSDTLALLIEGQILWEKPADSFRLNPGNLLNDYVETVDRNNECFDYKN